MVTFSRMCNCGVLEMDNLSACPTPEEAFYWAAKQLKIIHEKTPLPYVIFSGVVRKNELGHGGHARTGREDNYGEAFASYIEDNKLGEIVRSEVRRNWSGNLIQLWIWHLDYDSIFERLDRLEAEQQKLREAQ